MVPKFNDDGVGGLDSGLGAEVGVETALVLDGVSRSVGEDSDMMGCAVLMLQLHLVFTTASEPGR